MKWDPAGTSTHNTTASASVALSHRERLTASVWVCFPSVRHSAFRVIGWVAPPCFLTSTSLACQARGSRSSASVPFYLFVFYLNPPSPSLFLLVISHSSIPSPDCPLAFPSFLSASSSSLAPPSPLPSVSLSSPLLGWQCGRLMNQTACDSLAWEWIWCG